jgi:23S rRNA pseudouridine1911/1915/1917 synthase
MKKEIIAELTNVKLNIKEFLEQHCSMSSRKAKQLLKDKKVQINNKTAYYDNTVKNGDKVAVDISEAGKDSIVPENIPIEIIYEDEYFLAVNKPAGVLVHPTQNHPNGTLANGIKYYFASKGMDIPVRFANRIDMDTSGLVIIAKSGEAHAAIAAQFDSDSCEKFYLAVAEGIFAASQGIIDEPIGLDEANPIRRTVRADGQKSITEYQVLEQYKEAAYIQLKLITGRTHQIRVHLSSLGHALLGDKLYGGKDLYIQRQALHAFEMRFMHPYQKCIITLRAELAKDIKELVDALRN